MADTTTTTPQTAGVETPAAPSNVTDRMANYLNQWTEEQTRANEPPPPEPEPAAPQAAEPTAEQTSDQAQELTAEDLVDETAAPPSSDAFEIVHNGQQMKLSRADTIKYAQQGFDYDRKAQAVAEQAKQAQQRLDRIGQLEQISTAQMAELVQVEAFKAQLAPFQNVDWVRLATDNPQDYPRYRAQFDVAQQNFNQAVARFQQVSVKAQQERDQLLAEQLRHETVRIPELLPEWRDPEKRKAGEARIMAFLRSNGVPDDVMQAINTGGAIRLGALGISVLDKAARYDELMRNKAAKVGKLQTAPPVAKPGAAQTQSAQAEKQQQSMQRLRKSGTLQDAAAALAARLK